MRSNHIAVETLESTSNDEGINRTLDSESQEYSCTFCNKIFTTKKYLRSHLKTIHESPRLFICPLCGKQLAREKGLSQHVRTIHEGNWSVFCTICGKGFINQCRLKKHCTNVHDRSTRFPCSICEKGFASDAFRLNHMELMHSTSNKYACAQCKLNFRSRILLANHIREVHPDELPPFKEHTWDASVQCLRDVEFVDREALPKCEASQTTTLDCHSFKEQCRHSSERFLHCGALCEDEPLDLSLSNRSLVCAQTEEALRTSHPEVSSTSHEPDACFTDWELNNHSSHQSGEQNRQQALKCHKSTGRHHCTYCEKSFASKEYVRIHEATIHEGTKAFVCSICEKHFSVHQALRKHFIIQHEGGKPYRCRECKMEFRTRASLQSHKTIIHSE